ncbi:MAG TPA: DUF58 domain-containing protein [Verrucomicrobiales bacterium]|nr:DUF58 domain-containing protein [Verrucomicrobiales bacterium]
MIVPGYRLLFWFTALVVPAVLVATALPATVSLVAFLVAGFFLVVIVDAARGFGVLGGLAAALPPVVRMSKDRPGEFVMELANPTGRARQLRVGLDLPSGLGVTEPEQIVSIPAGQPVSLLKWACRPLQRGRFAIERVHLEAASPLGFWAMRTTVASQCELRVYPNLLDDRRGMAAMFLHRGALGIHAQRQMGKGRDFEQLRDYIPGDGMDEISWKATARRAQPVTKVFQIERTQEVYVIVDASRLSAREQPRPAAALPDGVDARGLEPDLESVTTLERYLTAALMLGLAAEQQNDHFGLITFAEQVKTFLRARSGRAHFDACRDELYTLQPRQVTPDFEELASFIRLRLRRRALLVFLTSLDDPVLAESFVKSMDLLCRQHLILVNMLPPPGVEPLFTSPDVRSINDVYDRLGAHHRWHQLRELEKVLRRRGVQFALLDNERMSPQLVSQYLGVKQRQLL